MTTGHIIRDNMVINPVQTGASAKVGTYFEKSWTGNDLVLPARPQSPVLSRPDRSIKLSKDAIAQIRLNNRAVIEDYKSRIRVWRRDVARARALARSTPHPYTMVSDQYLDTQGTYQWVGSNPVTCTFRSFIGSAGGSTSYTADDVLKLQGKLREKIIGSDFNLGVFLAESVEACELVRNAAERLAKGITYVQRKQYGKAAQALVGDRQLTRKERSANNWLQLQYGWRPLINDIQSGAEMLAHMNESPFTQRVSVRRKLPTNFKAATNFVDFSKKDLVHGLQLVAYLTEVDVPKLIGLTDAASVAWEKLPYSFVCDWVIPVGNFLHARALSASLKGTFVQTHFYRYSFSRPYSSLYPDLFINMTYYENQVGVERLVSNALQVPYPQIKGVKKTASWQHAANAIALLVGLKARS